MTDDHVRIDAAEPPRTAAASVTPRGTMADTRGSSGGLSRLSTDFGLADGAADGAQPDPLIGVDFAGVRIERLIAQGGMGRVYEGRQEQPARAVAVKVMRPGARSPANQQRFRREAEVLGRLRHPGIAQIYLAGCQRVGGAEIPFFVMEFVTGAEPLTQFCDRRGLPVSSRLELFAAACDAIAHGHAQGVVHRDLKPGNMLIDGDGRPKVIDFGIARLMDGDESDTASCTETGQFVGTRPYMSPEQFGTAGAIDARTDVYALGVVLHELLTGRFPHDLAGKSLGETARIVQEAAPAPLVVPDRRLGRGLAQIAATCLAKSPSRRYGSATELAADLRRLLDGLPLSDVASHRFGSLGGWFRRRRVAVVATTAAAAVVAALFLVGRQTSLPRTTAAGPRPSGLDAVPLTARFQAVSSGRTTPLQWIGVECTADVEHLAPADFRLTRDGQQVPLDTATVTGQGRNWKISGLETLTADEGTYVLELAGTTTSPVDASGNRLAAPARATWKMPASREIAFNLLDADWKQHLVSMTDAECYTERHAGATTFIRPTTAGKEGVAILRFDLPFTIHDATLACGIAVWTTGDPFPYDPGAKAAVDVSADGVTWKTVASLEANRGGFNDGPHDIGPLVAGGSQVWVRSRLVATRDWPGDRMIFAQFLRTDPKQERKTFRLTVTGPHPPVIPPADP